MTSRCARVWSQWYEDTAKSQLALNSKRTVGCVASQPACLPASAAAGTCMPAVLSVLIGTTQLDVLVDDKVEHMCTGCMPPFYL